jgi:hypothetical protein
MHEEGEPVMTLSLNIDECLDAELDRVSSDAGRSKIDIATEVVRRFIEADRRKRRLKEPRLLALAAELAEEDIALAEMGLDEYAAYLDNVDKA